MAEESDWTKKSCLIQIELTVWWKSSSETDEKIINFSKNQMKYYLDFI
jgi:hypothetical protein